MTIMIRLILYISYISPIVSPSQSNCKRFLSSISYKYMKSINHIPSPESASFTLPLHLGTFFWFISPNSKFRGLSVFSKS
jgi:hypothetical protein